MFPEMGAPLHYPFYFWMFHEINHPAIGDAPFTPTIWTPTIMNHPWYDFPWNKPSILNHTFIWVNCNISLTWIKAIWGWFPLLTIIPGFGRTGFGRYNLHRSIIWLIVDYCWLYIVPLYYHYPIVWLVYTDLWKTPYELLQSSTNRG